MIKVKEVRLVFQDWYETELSKTGWDSYGWRFNDDGGYLISNGIPNGSNWEITEILNSDKFGNPILGLATRETRFDFPVKENEVGEIKAPEPTNDYMVKVYVNREFLRYQKVKQIPNQGDIFILNHESRFVNEKALIVEAVIFENFFPQVYLKEE